MSYRVIVHPIPFLSLRPFFIFRLFGGLPESPIALGPPRRFLFDDDSSLLRALSNATPQVAPYPFTTLHPHLGRVRASADEEDAFTVADIPGLVDGAHRNRGLDHSFLRHVERTALFCYVLDLSPPAPAASKQLADLRREL